MGHYVAEHTIKKLVHSGKSIVGGKILICGFTFKENVPDIRNTKVVDIYKELIEYGACPVVYDPVVNPDEMFHEYGFRPTADVQKDAPYLAVILDVKHEQIVAEFNFARCKELQVGVPVVIDIKGILNPKEAQALGIQYYNL